jgi:trehalose 6-phosphate synthase/phosphatase
MDGEEWEAKFTSNLKWKDVVKPILLEYVRRCNGTFIEEKTGSIAWHYRNADSDFAQLRLNELRDDLVEIIRHKTNFEILEGNKVLEVKSGKYDKGQAATSIMKNKYFDFILAAGDDKTDESLFSALADSLYTIRVGLSPSLAKYNVPDIAFLMNLLKVLIK